ncbi:MAG: prepilin-type N-terminal cleavage/methylation domain-containing protein [Candidatus Firestonebacteria bacterium]
MNKEKGFTLIELMIVIAIIGLLIAIVIPDLLKTRRESEIQSCSASLRGVQSALELYYTHYKYYPEKLVTLLTEGYLSEGSDTDPWHMPYIYEPLSQGGDNEGGSGEGKTASNYLLGSSGPDGKKGTDDDIEPPINSSRHSLKSGGKTEKTPTEGETPAE